MHHKVSTTETFGRNTTGYHEGPVEYLHKVLFLLAEVQSGFASSFLYELCQDDKDLPCLLKENHLAMHSYLDVDRKGNTLKNIVGLSQDCFQHTETFASVARELLIPGSSD